MEKALLVIERKTQAALSDCLAAERYTIYHVDTGSTGFEKV